MTPEQHEAQKARNRERMRRIRSADPNAEREKRRRWVAGQRERDEAGYLAHQAAKQRRRREEKRSMVRAEDNARYRKHTERRKVCQQTTRARAFGATGRGVTLSEWMSIRNMTAGLCMYCARPAPLTFDHIDPLSRGGAHDIDNVTAVCESCNKSKGPRSLLLWLAKRLVA